MKKLFERFGDWVIARAMRTPYDTITHDGDTYMERFWLFRLGRWGNHKQYGFFAARVNHIMRSDNDRALHDHPWGYLTIILRGGYYEVTPADIEIIGIDTRTWFVSRWYGPGSILFRRAKSKHRLVVPTGTTAWTLFITGPKSQSWGFFVDGLKIYWRDYIKDHKQ